MTDWTPEQQREHRKLWVEALRSGKYQQGRFGLKKADAFCCLGVACDISGLGEWSSVPNGFGVCDFYIEDRHHDCALPDEVTAWLGLSDNGGGMTDVPSLWQLNDNDRQTFSQLADLIESEPAGLLVKTEAA